MREGRCPCRVNPDQPTQNQNCSFELFLKKKKKKIYKIINSAIIRRVVEADTRLQLRRSNMLRALPPHVDLWSVVVFQVRSAGSDWTTCQLQPPLQLQTPAGTRRDRPAAPGPIRSLRWRSRPPQCCSTTSASRSETCDTCRRLPPSEEVMSQFLHLFCFTSVLFFIYVYLFYFVFDQMFVSVL